MKLTHLNIPCRGSGSASSHRRCQKGFFVLKCIFNLSGQAGSAVPCPFSFHALPSPGPSLPIFLPCIKKEMYVSPEVWWGKYLAWLSSHRDAKKVPQNGRQGWMKEGDAVHRLISYQVIVTKGITINQQRHWPVHPWGWFHLVCLCSLSSLSMPTFGIFYELL